MKKPEVKTKTADASRNASAGKGTAIGKIEPVKAAAAAAPAAPKKPFNPVKFFTEVRAEAKKITWTTRKETWITTVMVMIMVVLAAIFFFLVDAVLGWGTNLLTKLGQ